MFVYGTRGAHSDDPWARRLRRWMGIIRILLLPRGGGVYAIPTLDWNLKYCGIFLSIPERYPTKQIKYLSLDMVLSASET